MSDEEDASNGSDESEGLNITKRVEGAAESDGSFGLIAAVVLILLVLVFGRNGNGGAPGA
jgi:hypothetical protein